MLWIWYIPCHRIVPNQEFTRPFFLLSTCTSTYMYGHRSMYGTTVRIHVVMYYMRCMA